MIKCDLFQENGHIATILKTIICAKREIASSSFFIYDLNKGPTIKLWLVYQCAICDQNDYLLNFLEFGIQTLD